MRRGKRILLCCVLATAFALLTAVTLQSRSQDAPQPKRKNVEVIDEGQWPVTDLNSPAPADPSERDQRRAKSRKHNKSLLGLKGAIQSPPPAGRMILITHWEVGLPALPTEQSSAVVVGEVMNARAYVSTDQTSVYSEFTIQVREVLKNDERASLAPGISITADRQGGRVRMPSGAVVLFTIRHQKMPLVGRDYVFFLAGGEPDSNYHLITGYELREGRVFPLDEVKGRRFEDWGGKETQALLQSVRDAVAN